MNRKGKRKRNAFPEVRGKIVEGVELHTTDYGCAIGVMFEDKTFLSFEVEVETVVTILPDLSDWKSGDGRPLKRWPIVTGRVCHVRDGRIVRGIRRR